MLNLIVFGLFAVLVAAMAYQAVQSYRAATGTAWQRTLATARGSATWLLAKSYLVAGFLIEAAAQAADFFNMPDVDSFVRTQIPVQYVGWALIGIAGLGFAARARSLFRRGD